jgi:Na+-translocating ferredoxin:NAD+ oxidoreductase subunit G
MNFKRPLYRKMTRTSAILMVFTVLCVLILTGVNWLTTPYIEQAKQEKEKLIFIDLFHLDSTELESIKIECRSLVSKKVLGTEEALPVKNFSYNGIDYQLIQAVAPDGYNGSIRIAVAMSPDKIIGLRILQHKETPGLGDKIEREKSNWVNQFDQLDLSMEIQWDIKKLGGQFDGFTGATITPQAILKAVKSLVNNRSLVRRLLMDAQVCSL